MKSSRSIKTTVAVVFALSLILSSGVQASSLLGLDRDLAPRTAAHQPAGLFDQVSVWLIGAWNNLTAVFAEETATPSTNTSTCEAGWGLDPEGCPKG